MLPGIFRSQITEFSVIVFRLVDTPFFQRQLRQLIQEPLSDGRSLIGQEKHFFCLLIFPVLFIYLGNH